MYVRINQYFSMLPLSLTSAGSKYFLEDVLGPLWPAGNERCTAGTAVAWVVLHHFPYLQVKQTKVNKLHKKRLVCTEDFLKPDVLYDFEMYLAPVDPECKVWMPQINFWYISLPLSHFCVADYINFIQLPTEYRKLHPVRAIVELDTEVDERVLPLPMEAKSSEDLCTVSFDTDSNVSDLVQELSLPMEAKSSEGLCTVDFDTDSNVSDLVQELNAAASSTSSSSSYPPNVQPAYLEASVPASSSTLEPESPVQGDSSSLEPVRAVPSAIVRELNAAASSASSSSSYPPNVQPSDLEAPVPTSSSTLEPKPPVQASSLSVEPVLAVPSTTFRTVMRRARPAGQSVQSPADGVDVLQVSDTDAVQVQKQPKKRRVLGKEPRCTKNRLEIGHIQSYVDRWWNCGHNLYMLDCKTYKSLYMAATSSQKARSVAVAERRVQSLAQRMKRNSPDGTNRMMYIMNGEAHYTGFFFDFSDCTYSFLSSMSPPKQAVLEDEHQKCVQVLLEYFGIDASNYSCKDVHCTLQGGAATNDCGWYTCIFLYLCSHHMDCAGVRKDNWISHLDTVFTESKIIVPPPVDYKQCNLCSLYLA